MEAAIYQRVRILDPRTLPGYSEQAERRKQFIDAEMSGRAWTFGPNDELSFQRTGPLMIKPDTIYSPDAFRPGLIIYSELAPINKFEEEFEMVSRGTPLWRLVFPYVLDGLGKLGIMVVYDLETAFTRKKPETISMDGLMRSLAYVGSLPASFHAKINPPFNIGKHRVKVMIPDPRSLLYVDSNSPQDNYEDSELQAPRIITISGNFTDPKAARIGLSDISSISTDAIFDELLTIGTLPKKIAARYAAIRDYVHPNSENVSTSNSAFNEGVYKERVIAASLEHLRFLRPVLESLGVKPNLMQYYEDGSNFNYRIEVRNWADIADLVSRGYYNGFGIPSVDAVFQGGKVTIHFPSWAHQFNSALQATQDHHDGTLESILTGTLSIR